MEFSNVDWFIIITSLLSGLFFILTGLDKLHKFYFGFLMGLLIFILINQSIDIAEANADYSSLLLNNASFVLSLIAFFIPILGLILVLTDYISFKVSGSKISSFIFGSLLIIFLLLIYSYISHITNGKISFLTDFFEYFADKSIIITYLFARPGLCALIIFLLVFIRLFLRIFSTFLIYLYGLIRSYLRNEEEEEG